ncbi:MAG: phytase [Niabella sp.]
MKKITVYIGFVLLVTSLTVAAQEQTGLNEGWMFSKAAENKWYKASVPGMIHTDLLANSLIEDPYFGNNEEKLQWIGASDWVYKRAFDVPSGYLSKKNIEIVFDGLDTYADVFLNGIQIISAKNMFRQWRSQVKKLLKPTNNQLYIIFHSAERIADSLTANAKIYIPNHPRAYVRKAPFQFGWDWGPKFVTCGIWKEVRLEAYDRVPQEPAFVNHRKVELVREKDSIGESFYFKLDGTPVYMKGANWIPNDVFLPGVKKEDYEKLIKAAKEANMNMLRVWGGGVYEDDIFYNLCDKYGINVWQDFMFGTMVPGDEDFFDNVREEVKYQVKRLRHHPCIVLWCGNNEMEEGWYKWDWQRKFNLHGSDSAAVWSYYKRLFIDSLPVWIKKYDGTRPYISSSPEHGLAKIDFFKQADAHYWGVWWEGKDIESYGETAGRFMSEYGMQAMPDYATVKSFTKPEDRYLFSDVIKNHQKADEGFEKMNFYLHKYFIDSNVVKTLPMRQYVYITNVLQYYTLKNAVALQMRNYPVNMGTLVWQMNDAWPVCSWSIIDYRKNPKGGWYALKNVYNANKPEPDSLRPVQYMLTKPAFKIVLKDNEVFISTNRDAKYVFVYTDKGPLTFSDNYFDLKAGENKSIRVENPGEPISVDDLKVMSLYDIQKAAAIKPVVVTDPVVYDSDDPAIWINPKDTSKSLIIGTDKETGGGIYAFDLSGKIVARDTGLLRPNNVDVAYGLDINDKKVDIAVFTERNAHKIRIYQLPELKPIDNGGIDVFAGETKKVFREGMGIALYKNKEGRTYAIVGRKNGPDGTYLWQYELKGNRSGHITAKVVRKFGRYSGKKEIESIAVDAELGFVYYSDEQVGVRKYYADPEKGNEELALFATSGYPEDHEGISIYKTSGNTGYILVSNQGDNSFMVYPREGAGNSPNEHPLIAKVRVSTRSSDGSEVTHLGLGSKFPKGLFTAMSEGKVFHYYDWRDFQKEIDRQQRK